ncbi:MAG: TonB-dependent receptor [bacterium]
MLTKHIGLQTSINICSADDMRLKGRRKHFIDKFKILSVILILLTLMINNSISAENGIISGTVVDATTGEPMIGARIMIKGTNYGNLTKVKGDFRISNINPGNYTVVVSYVGYNTTELPNIRLEPGQIKNLEIVIKENGVLKDEIIVTADAILETGAALLKERQKAGSVSDAISAEEISRGGSGDAADAIKKVTGATTVGGKHVYIRGLGDRYSSTQLNGANLPSADPDKKSVHLDLFPAGMIENITTIKTATPDRPGDFTGGTVNISTKSFPERLKASISMTTAMNTQTTGSSILGYTGSSTDWLAMDDGSRSIPDIILNNKIPAVTEARSKTKPESIEKAKLLDKQSKAFNPTFAPANKIASIDQNFSATLGNQHILLDNPFGYFASFSYGRKFSSFNNGTIATYSQPGSDSRELEAEYKGKLTESTDEVAWGGMMNISYNLDENNRTTFNYIYNRNSESEAQFQDGWTRYYNSDRQTRALNFIERSISSYQLEGLHNFASFGGMKLDWLVSLSNNKQNQPDYRTFDNEYIKNEDGSITYLLNKNDNNALPSRYYRDLSEDLTGIGFNIEIPIKNIFDNQFKFKTGFLFDDKSRTFEERRYVYRQDGDDLIFNGDVNEFMSDSTGIRDWKSSGNFNYFGNYIEDRTQASGSYKGTQEIYAGYGMIDWYVFESFRIVGGFRYETTELHTISNDSSRPVGSISEEDLLPSLNLTYILSKNMNLRMAYGKTLARPTFREIAPYDSYLPIEHKTLLGNADLKRTLIDNYDIRWEWFTNPGEIVSAGVFYKDFTNPIELAIVNYNNNVMPKNVDKAFLYGAEIEFRKNLDFMDLLKNFYFGMNLTLVHSQVDLSELEMKTRIQYDSNASTTRELQGQSPYVVNLDVAYVNAEWGTDASVYFNVFGKRLSEVGFGTPDYYEFPKPELNFVISQIVFENIKLKFSAKNILDSKYYKASTYKGVDYISEQYILGRTFSFSVGYIFD